MIVYLYEGNTDPADELAVYAISSKHGMRGIMVAVRGRDDDGTTSEILLKLKKTHTINT